MVKSKQDGESIQALLDMRKEIAPERLRALVLALSMSVLAVGCGGMNRGSASLASASARNESPVRMRSGNEPHEYTRGGHPIYDAAPWNPGLGVPGGQLEDAGGAMSGNYRLRLPIIQLPGRGLDLDLSLYYNSQLWSRQEFVDGGETGI